MLTILIIDDIKSVREELALTLEFEGFNIIQAENGRTGVELAFETHPDLIISDIQMPLLDGFGVLSEVRNNLSTQDIPFILITANYFQEDISKSKRLKNTRLITKPCNMNNLINTINLLANSSIS